MLKILLVLAVFCVVFSAILRGIDIILQNFDLLPSKYQAEKQDCIANGIVTPIDAGNFHLASHHAVANCEVDISGVCTEAAANLEGLSESIQLVVENAGEHIGTMLEGL